MALPPTVPTSFVPKQPVAPGRKRSSTGSNPFLALSLFIFFITILGSLATFGYQYYLEGIAKKKADAVTTAQNEIDQATVTSFIRLRDRFTASKEVLNRQVALSQYFDLLETVTLQTVRFSNLKMAVGDDRKGTITMSGNAKTFNALAAQSQTLAGEKRIKRAIFSGINGSSGGVGAESGVTFVLTADVDPTLVQRVAAPEAAAPAAPTAPEAAAQDTGTPPPPTP